jgi:hypothetical protein
MCEYVPDVDKRAAWLSIILVTMLKLPSYYEASTYTPEPVVGATPFPPLTLSGFQSIGKV